MTDLDHLFASSLFLAFIFLFLLLLLLIVLRRKWLAAVTGWMLYATALILVNASTVELLNSSFRSPHKDV